MSDITKLPENSISVTKSVGLSTSFTGNGKSIYINPQTSEYIYQYSNGEEINTFAEQRNSGKTDFISQLSDIAIDKRSDLQNKNIFVYGNVDSDDTKKIYPAITNITNTNIDPFNNLSVVNPTYKPRSISDYDTVGGNDDVAQVTINKKSFDYYRFSSYDTSGRRLESINQEGIEINILDGNGKKIENKTLNIGKMTDSGEDVIASLIGEIHPSHKASEYVITSNEYSSNLEDYTTKNFDIYNDVSSTNTTAVSDFKLEFLTENDKAEGSKKNFFQPKYSPNNLVPDGYKKFYNSEMGIVRVGEKDGKTIDGELPEEELKRTEKSPKVQIEPVYHFNNSTINEKDGEIKSLDVKGATKVFTSTNDSTKISRHNPFDDNNTITNPDSTMLGSKPGLISRNDFIVKIGNKFKSNKVNVKKFDGSTTELNTDELGKDMGCGCISVLYDSRKSWPAGIAYTIPFQFTPEITGESRSANWVGSTTLGKTNEYFMWATTASRTISFRTSYAVIAPDETSDPWFMDKPNKSGSETMTINPIYNNNWGKYWTESKISEILKLYRKLLIPSSFSPNTDINDGNRVAPPVITIDFSSSLNLKWNNTSKNDQQIKSRWIITDLSIDPKTEVGLTKNKNPRMYEISLTLKEQPINWDSRQFHSQITR